MPRISKEYVFPNKYYVKKTHTLYAGSKIFDSLPKVENPSATSITQIDEQVLMIEQFIGYRGLFSKFSMEGEKGEKIFYTLDSNLNVLPSIGLNYIFINAPDADVARIVPEDNQDDPQIPEWYNAPFNEARYDDTTHMWYCNVEIDYKDETGVDPPPPPSEERLSNIIRKGYFLGLQSILKRNGKKHDIEYIKTLADKVYFFGYAADWFFDPNAKCSNVYILAKFPARYLNSSEIIDYREDSRQRAEDNISTKMLDPRVDLDQIRKFVRIPLFGREAFTEIMTDFTSKIYDFWELQRSFVQEECRTFIGSVTEDDYYRETGLKLIDEADKFIKADNVKNFTNTIINLLTENRVNLDKDLRAELKTGDTEDVKVFNKKLEIDNNIMFGLDNDWNIRYIDVVKDGKVVPLLTGYEIFDKSIGEAGVIGTRSGFLLFNIPIIRFINEANGVQDVDYETFVRKFITPPPKVLDYPKVSMECVKDNLQKLKEDVIIKGYQSVKEVSKVFQFNVKKMRAIQSRGPFATAGQVYGEALDGAGNFFASGVRATNEYLSDGGRRVGKAATNEIKKIFRRADFQKALIARIICMLKNQDNQAAMDSWNNTVNPKVKKAIQDFLKNMFCNGTIQNLIKAFQAFKRPKFEPIDVTAAMRKAIKRALLQLVTELYAQILKDLIAALGNCGDLNQNNRSPDQDTGVNAALEDLLDNKDDGINTPPELNDAYDNVGIPKSSAGDEGSRANPDMKQKLKDLVADLACLLLPTELCQLMTEDLISDSTFQKIKSVIIRKYPDLMTKLQTREQIQQFFRNLGAALNMTETCKALKGAPPDIRSICDTGGLTDQQKKNLEENNLTDDQINDLLDQIKKDKAKRYDDILDAISKSPRKTPKDDMPILCRPNQPGKVNPAVEDTTYMHQVGSVMNGALQPIYEMFNKDADSMATNMIQNKFLDFSPQEIKDFNLATKGKNSAKALQLILVAKGILVPDWARDDQGKLVREDEDDPRSPLVQKEDDDGNKMYVFNTDQSSLPVLEPSISPILSGTLATADYFKKIDANTINLEVNSDAERLKFLAVSVAEVERQKSQDLKDVYTEARAKIVAMVTNEIVSVVTEILARVVSDQGLDAEFWVGWTKMEEKGGFERWFSRITAMVLTLLKFLDIFMADLVNEPRGPLNQPPLLSGGNSWSFAKAPRQRERKPSDSATRIRDVSNTFDQYYYEGSFVGSVSDDFYLYGTDKDSYYVNKTTAEEAGARASANEVFDSLRDTDGTLDTSDEALMRMFEAVAVQETAVENVEQVETGNDVQASVAEVKKGDIDMSVFTKTEQIFSDISADMEAFGNSLVIRPIIDIFSNITKILSELKERVETVYLRDNSANAIFNTAENAFPNYTIEYVYAKETENNLTIDNSKLGIKVNGNFVGENYLELSEQIDPRISSYIAKYDLFAGHTPNVSLRETAFKNYMNKKQALQNTGAARAQYRFTSYAEVEKSIFQSIYEDIKNSPFYRSSYKDRTSDGKTTRTYFPNIRHFSLREASATAAEKACGMENNSLNLDNLKDDALNDFKNNACNHQPPDPLGGPRAKMNPIENVIADVLMLATIRVYMYDYLSRAIFLFDKYRVGMVATDPLLELLARLMESEMRTYGNTYYQKFLDNAEFYHDKTDRYQSSVREIYLKYGEEGFHSKEARNIKFKKIIAEQIYFISSKLTSKIFEAQKSIEDQLNSSEYTDSLPTKAEVIARKNKNDPSTATDITKGFKQIPRFLEDAKRGVKKGPFSIVDYGTSHTLHFNDLTLAFSYDPTLPEEERTDEFKFIFEYCFPIRKYLGLVAFQCILAGAAFPSISKTFVITKSVLKTKQNGLMEARGIGSPNDTGSTESKDTPSSEPNAYKELIIKLLWSIPKNTLKNLCEAADPNVFLATFPYRIVRPFTVAFINQIPYIPKPGGTPDNPGVNLSWSIPALGFGLVWAGAFPTPFGILYYILGCWYDEFIKQPKNNDNTDNGVNQAADLSRTEECAIRRRARSAQRTDNNYDLLLITQYT